MKPSLRLLACFFASALLLQAAANPAFNGRWKLDPGQSTSLDPWSALEMEISAGADTLSVVRHYSAGTRVADETLALKNQPVTQTVTVEGWWDNRHIDAWLANANQIDVTPEWRDDGNTLVLHIRMILETQQGERAVGVTRTLKLDDDGRTLREVQVRESRRIPVVHVYQKL